METPGLFCVYGVLCEIAAQAAPPPKKSAPWAGNPGGEVLAVLMAANLARYLGRCKVLGWGDLRLSADLGQKTLCQFCANIQNQTAISANFP